MISPQATETTTEADKPWIPVTNRHRTKSPPAPFVTPPTQDTGGRQQTVGVFAPGFNLPPDERKVQPTPGKPCDTTNNTEDRSSRNTDSHVPSITTIPRDRPASNPMIATNDGTHRITVKWKLNATEYSIGKMEQDKQYLGEVVHMLLKSMFHDSDGHFYRWESADLVNARVIFQLTETEMRDFISPNITFVKTTAWLSLEYDSDSFPTPFDGDNRDTAEMRRIV